MAYRLQQTRNEGQQAIVLASGDSLCYGIEVSLCRHFPADALEIIPVASAFQLGFVALAEPSSDAVLLIQKGVTNAGINGNLIFIGAVQRF